MECHELRSSYATLFLTVLLISFADEAREHGYGVLVHCHAGVSRSATVTVAYIMKQQGLCLGDAYKFVKELRPVISPNLNFMGQLLKYERNRRNGDSSWGSHVVTLLSRFVVALFWCTRVWYSVAAEILPHTPSLQRLFIREQKQRKPLDSA